MKVTVAGVLMALELVFVCLSINWHPPEVLVRLVKAMVFPVVMYGFESWTVKKAEQQRIDVFCCCCLI